MIAASLSNDPVMLEFYRSDPYLSFAKRVGAAPSSATKHTHEPLRDRYKTGLLAIQYGIQAETLGARLGVSTFDAHEMINQHHELFARVLALVRRLAGACARHRRDVDAARLDTAAPASPSSTRARFATFPVQGSGADILRIACIWATRHGLRLLAPVHDAVLIEAPIERIEADVALMQEIMRRASRVVLGAAHELRTDAKIIRHPDRYTDRRGDAVWANVLRLLAEYRQGAMPCEPVRHAN